MHEEDRGTVKKSGRVVSDMRMEKKRSYHARIRTCGQ